MTNNKQQNINFWGVNLNEEEIKNHRLSYATLSKQFDAVLCNDIYKIDEFLFDNVENGSLYYYYYNDEEMTEEEKEEAQNELEEKINELENLEELTEEQQSQLEELQSQLEELENLEEIQEEIYQYYIISDYGKELLSYTNEIVFYSELLNCYVWGVTHWGTSWDYVLTSIKLSEDFNSVESWK